jgi:hypothetical protein
VPLLSLGRFAEVLDPPRIHARLGGSDLECGRSPARLEAEIRETLWQTDSVAEQKADHLTFPGPSPGFVEQVYEHALIPGEDGMHRVAVVNDRLGMKVSVEWPAAEFPYFFEWLNLRSGNYAVGLEPSTHHVSGDAAAREDGSMIWLESRVYHTTFRVS